MFFLKRAIPVVESHFNWWLRSPSEEPEVGSSIPCSAFLTGAGFDAPQGFYQLSGSKIIIYMGKDVIPSKRKENQLL